MTKPEGRLRKSWRTLGGAKRLPNFRTMFGSRANPRISMSIGRSMAFCGRLAARRQSGDKAFFLMPFSRCWPNRDVRRPFSSISRQPETMRRLQFSSMAILTSSPKAKVGATGASLLNRRLRVNVFTDAVPRTMATTFTPRWWLCMRLKKRASRTAASSDCTRRTKSAARATLSIGCRRVERGSGTLDS